MGSYLSEPETEKESIDHFNDKLNCGASSMQGWRVSQEDAHNCILDFDTNSALFAVYDGHGGSEVAQYCADRLPQFIKASESYKADNITQALIDGFLNFDSTIATEEVITVLKDLAGVTRNEASEGEEDEDENVANLYEEAAMPIEQVIEKYTSNVGHPTVRALKCTKAGDKLPKSPYLKAKTESEDAVSDTTPGCSTSYVPKCSKQDGASSSSSTSSSSTEPIADVEKVSSSSNGTPIKSGEIVTPTNTPNKSEIVETNVDIVTEKRSQNEQNGNTVVQDVVDSSEKNEVSSSVIENGDLNKKDKGKGKQIVVNKPTRPKRNAQQLYKQWLDFEDDSDEDTDEEDDKTFEGPNDESSSDECEPINVSVESADSEDSSNNEEDEEEEDEDDEDTALDAETEEGLEFARNMKEEPGSDSGCTAVVAILKGNELYVANAGDSRCIICRNGKAFEMSFDHKPEDTLERDRIVKAGGKVTSDGRVNGGLNLSRAIGDHAYKQNKDLSDKEQMITALPDINNTTVNLAEDEFMVLACDGIWNFMSSQEVVDFVRPRIQDGALKLSQICEELFDHCLAPNTIGDGTGCDNMTAIIVTFKSNILKRSASPFEQSESKMAKTDNGNLPAETAV